MSFRNFIPYLSEFNYPNITDASDEHLEEVFSAGNRPFLLRWLIKHLNSKLIIATDWTQRTKLVVADYFSDSGFCFNSEKEKFVTKDNSLSLEQEVAIFERIFHYMRNSCQRNEESVENELTTKELQMLLNKEVDLFPQLQAVKLRGKAETAKKIKEITAKIEEFKRLTQNCSQSTTDVQYEVSENDTRNNIDKFTNQLWNLQVAASKVKLSDSLCKETSNTAYSEMNLGEKLYDLDCKSKQLLMHTQTANLMQDVQNRENVEYKNEMKEMCQELAKDSSEIVEMQKNQ